ncbi:MAG: hypothetical protein GEV03_27290 [Streptosporangiales bacterium]|nr:hypothetical protein [Streptosporangiales bacterium]
MTRNRLILAVALVVVVLVAGVLLWASRNPLKPFTGFPEGTEVVADDEGGVEISQAKGASVGDVDLDNVEELGTAPDGRLAVSGFGWGLVAGPDGAVRFGTETGSRALRLIPTPEDEVVVSSGCNLERVDASGQRTRLLGREEVCPVSEWAKIYSDPGIPATFERIGPIMDLDVSAEGTLYLADAAGNRILRLDGGGDLEQVAGSGAPWGSIEDGQRAVDASFKPGEVAAGPDGSVFLLPDPTEQRTGGVVYRIDPGGSIAAVGGGGYAQPSDGVRATDVEFAMPSDLAADDAGNVYVGLNCCREEGGSGFRGVVRITSDGRLDVVFEPRLNKPEDFREVEPFLGGVAADDESLYVSLTAGSSDEHYGKVMRVPLGS